MPRRESNVDVPDHPAMRICSTVETELNFESETGLRSNSCVEYAIVEHSVRDNTLASTAVTNIATSASLD